MDGDAERRVWSLGAGYLAGARDMGIVNRGHMYVWKSTRLHVYLLGGPECSSGVGQRSSSKMKSPSAEP